MRSSLLVPFAASTLLLMACGGSSGSDSTGTGAGGQAHGSSSSTAGSGGEGGSGGSAPTSVTVTTQSGEVKGTGLGSTREFLGIPYAAPPTGALRWKPPQAAAVWTSPRDATQRGPACPQLMQLGSAFDTTTSEDCLTLNIWTPKNASGAPVLFWIHGGGFTSGTGGDPTFDGQAFSETTGAVIVTINYRLGPLGFLSLAGLASEDQAHPTSGLYGFEDQRFAMQWVKANIAAFGGDPTNVTIFGESAGGVSTCLHLVSPQSQGLFARAIVESGACHSSGQTEADARPQGESLATTLGCTDAATELACLRGKTPAEITTALPLRAGEIAGPGANWFPVVDGANIPDQPYKLLDAGQVAKVPTIFGTNKDEGTIFFALGLSAKDDTEYLSVMDQLFPGHGQAILAKYPSSAFPSTQDAATAAVGDGVFACSARRTVRAMTKAGAPSYLYQFVHVPTTGLFQDLGAFHSVELPFVFQSSYLNITLDDDELKLAKTIEGYWFGLAKSGDPNFTGAPNWPVYDATKDQNQVLDLTISTGSKLKSDLCDFWDGLGF